MADGESTGERLDRELIELLQELRVMLPGVQVLLAFLLVAPSSSASPSSRAACATPSSPRSPAPPWPRRC